MPMLSSKMAKTPLKLDVPPSSVEILCIGNLFDDDIKYGL